MNKKKFFKSTPRYLVLIIIGLITLIPIFTIVLTAIKSKSDFFSGQSLFEFPSSIHWENFKNAFINGNLFVYMKNSLIISLVKVPIGILVCASAAFALTRLKLKNSKMIFIVFLVGMMLPMQVALVPLNVFFNKLGLINSYVGLTYVYIGFGIPYGILVLRGFFKAIPRDIDEAAYIDGCSKFRLFFSIILPIAKPALATIFITDFLSTWNEYLLASILITDSSKKTITTGLLSFVGEHGIDYGLLSAGVLINIIPILIVYLFFQRYFVEGFSGAVK
ncbi:carbohydrate ABC transporter permease [Enterococcus sp. LJL120]